MAMVDWSQSQSQQHHNHHQPTHLEIAAKAYLENNVRYYLQNVNNTTAETKGSPNRNAATDFIVRATKLSKTSTTTNTTANRSTTPLFSQIVTSLQPMPNISSTTPIKNQTIISNRFPRQEHPLGKVKVILQISHQQEEPTPYLKVDSSRKHLTLYDPTLLSSYEQNQRPTAPKMYAFDAIVNTGGTNSSNNSLELSKAALPELIDAVMNGNDAVLFALGKTGTHETMLATNGLMVYSINWLFSALKASKRRFAIKCTAAQINHNSITDLLAQHHSSSSPTSLSSPICSAANTKLLKSNAILSQLREMSCISAKRAAHCLDISANYNYTQNDHNSMLFTLHLYQYKIITTANGKNTVVGGRSKLHLFDLSPSTKNLTNVLLAIFNGQKHIPNKDSKLTAVLKECLSSMLVWTSVVANITNAESNYLDTVTTCQFVTRIHRSRIIYNGRSKMRRLAQHNFSANFSDPTRAEAEAVNNSETESAINCYTSSSEHSVDTVIFCGKSNINHNHTEISSTNKLHYNNVPTNTSLTSIQVQTCSLKEENHQKEESKRFNDSKHITEPQMSSPNHRSKEVKKSDELWVDGPKRSRRKKDHSMKWSQELWVDGPNAQLDNNNTAEVDNTICYHEEKQHRIQQWIQQHTKHIWSDFPTNGQPSPTQTPDSAYSSDVKQPHQKISSPEMLDVSCQTDMTPSGSTVTPSDSEWSLEDPLKVLSDDEIFKIERIAGAGREAMSDCCDNEYLLNSGYDDIDDCHSEPITEPPKQLKLEQFLQQLTTITMPHIHHHQHRDSCHKKDHEYRSLRHPDGASDHNISISQWDLPKPDFNDFSTFSYSSAKEVVKSPSTTSRPLSASSPPPTTAPTEPHFLTSSPNHAVLPTSPRVNRLLSSTTITSAHSSPSKSSISRKQQKIEQQLKRNTTSTTTSGHGTTSEGECSSVAKKTSSVSSPSFMSHHPVVQRQPASSGYESTVHDDDSDRELVTRRPEIGATIIESVTGTPVKMRNKKSEICKDDKNRLSTSSDRCSFLCCKFMKFYQ